MVQIATVTLISAPPSPQITLTRGNTNPTTIVNAPPVTVALTRQVGDGPTGPRGASVSGGGSSYEHTQNSPQATWVIVHNLGRHPSVVVTGFDGEFILTGYKYLDANIVEVNFTYPNSGMAYLN